MSVSSVRCLALSLGLAFVAACAPPRSTTLLGRDVAYQYSTLDALARGYYDGEATIEQIREHGDFGLGTFDGLDGEMVELDGQTYQVQVDGLPYLVPEDTETPFALVTYFESDDSFRIGETLDCVELQARIDERLPTLNIPFAIRVAGDFAYVEARSVPRQTEPYPPLEDVIAQQTVFEFTDVEGTLVGFRMPSYVESANVPGYHWHFLTADRLGGGHVLRCRIDNVRVDIDYTDEWHIALPSNEAFYELALETASDESE